MKIRILQIGVTAAHFHVHNCDPSLGLISKVVTSISNSLANVWCFLCTKTNNSQVVNKACLNLTFQCPWEMVLIQHSVTSVDFWVNNFTFFMHDAGERNTVLTGRTCWSLAVKVFTLVHWLGTFRGNCTIEAVDGLSCWHEGGRRD